MKIIKFISIIFLGIILWIPIYYFGIEKLIISDACYWHSHNPGVLFNAFYDLPSSEGYHPVPTNLNFGFNIVIGCVIGLIAMIFYNKA